ncbi:MAG: radical SAM family heme chaperone HemW [Mycoplasmoidaceae bacterium]
MAKSLYIHIPFCKKFCAYCDFVKCIYNKQTVDKYIDLVLKKLKKNKYETIYLGGGTPNCLSDKQLEKLLKPLSKCLAKNYEFTIECNSEFVTNSQAKILTKYKVNRVSLGVQTLDSSLLKSMNRSNHKFMVEQAISILQKNKITNISCDLIYGFQKQTNESIKNDIDFLLSNKVRHISCYSLEIKENTIWGKQNYKTNELEIEDHLKFIIDYMNKLGLVRYEVSNWAISSKYQSKHNIAVWKTNDWAAIGLGAHGMENKTLYHYEGSVLNWKLVKEKLSDYDLYFQVLMMGLRLKEGLDLSNPLHKKAYQFFKKRMDQDLLIKNNKKRIWCSNINLLDNFLIKLNEYEEK